MNSAENNGPRGRMNRREAIRWMLGATATLAISRSLSAANLPHGPDTPVIPVAPPATPPSSGTTVHAVGYGTDPDLLKTYKPGDFWPLTLTDEQRQTAAALCAAIIPADSESPSAADVGVPDFIDEWISAPYPGHDRDRERILTCIQWMDTEANRRFGKKFAQLNDAQVRAICDDVCYEPKAAEGFRDAANCFARFRDLTAGGFYTTPEGMKDIKYVGNVPLPSFDGPPIEALRQVGLA